MFVCLFNLYFNIFILTNTKSLKKAGSRPSLCHQRPCIWLFCCVPGILTLAVSHFPHDHGSSFPCCPRLSVELPLLLFSGRTLVSFICIISLYPTGRKPLDGRLFQTPQHNPSKQSVILKLFLFAPIKSANKIYLGSSQFLPLSLPFYSILSH